MQERIRLRNAAREDWPEIISARNAAIHRRRTALLGLRYTSLALFFRFQSHGFLLKEAGIHHFQAVVNLGRKFH